MNPHKAKKIDINTLSPEEQRLFRLYGKLPSRSDHFAKHLKDRKYFDSGDYAMSKAGKGDGVDTGSVGSQHPVPENIPHLSSPVGAAGSNNGIVGIGAAGATLLHPHQHHSSMQAGSPVKESSFLNRETTAEDLDASGAENKTADEADSKPAEEASPTPTGLANSQDGIPIRR